MQFPLPNSTYGSRDSLSSPALKYPSQHLSGVHGDPHMQGLRGQKIDWSGVDGGWYSLIKDDTADVNINVRVTAPLPDQFPDRQLIT
ncbi:unnamed protein product, partial [Ectocarpus sp. 13 AM-2016]